MMPTQVKRIQEFLLVVTLLSDRRYLCQLDRPAQAHVQLVTAMTGPRAGTPRDLRRQFHRRK